MSIKNIVVGIVILLLLAGIVNAGCPSITTKSANRTDEIGTGGAFSFVSNQTGLISWKMNGTLKQYEQGSSATYVNRTAGVQTTAHNVSVTIKNTNGEATYSWTFNVTATTAAEAFGTTPATYPNTTYGIGETFRLSTNKTFSYVWWYVNSTRKQVSAGDDSTYTASYTNTTAGIQNNPYTVTAIVNSTGGNSTTVTWKWRVLTIGQPGFTGYLPATNPSDLNTSSRSFNVSFNQTGTIKWYINGTLKQTDSATSASIYTNSTAGWQANPYNVTVNFTGTNGSTYRTWAWTRTIVPRISVIYPPEGSTSVTTNVNFSNQFNVSADRTTNVTFYLDGIAMQFNESITTASYNNTNASLGMHTVAATTNNTNGTGNTVTWYWSIPNSTMTGMNMSTNLTGITGRVPMNVNYTLNFTWADTGNISRINFTFPTSFGISSLVAASISSNIGTITGTLGVSTGLVSIYNITQGANNSGMYVNFTSKLKTPSTPGNYIVTVTTNKNATGANFTVYVRNESQPYLTSINNTVFSIASETFGDKTTTISLTGKGNANLTIAAPNITRTTNVTVGYGATNASIIKAIYNEVGQGINYQGNYTLFVETDPSVTNPVITISYVNEMSPSNLPTGIVIVAISGAIIVYIFRRRRH